MSGTKLISWFMYCRLYTIFVKTPISSVVGYTILRSSLPCSHTTIIVFIYKRTLVTSVCCAIFIATSCPLGTIRFLTPRSTTTPRTVVRSSAGKFVAVQTKLTFSLALFCFLVSTTGVAVLWLPIFFSERTLSTTGIRIGLISTTHAVFWLAIVASVMVVLLVGLFM